MITDVFEEVVAQHAPRILAGGLILLISVAAALLIRRSVVRLLRGVARESGTGRFVAGAFYYAILILGLLTALNTMGVKMGPLIAGLGLGGFALGFALRDVLSNLLAGILILLYRPFRVGDFLAVSGCQGTVSEINLRYTVLGEGDDTFMIPNGVIFTNPLRVRRPAEASNLPRG